MTEQIPRHEDTEPPQYQPPTYDELLAEQRQVQADRFIGRTLEWYNVTIFPDEDDPDVGPSAVAELVRPLCNDGRASLEGLVASVREAKGGEPVVVADMCGGRGLALRQLATLNSDDRLLNIDLFDHGLDGLRPKDIEALDAIHPLLRNEVTAPELILADAQDVQLPESPDLIVGVEGIQYLDNPLGTISSWYNQLADDGWLIIAAHHDWARWMQYANLQGETDLEVSPVQQLFEAFDEQDVSYAAAGQMNWTTLKHTTIKPAETRSLIVRKKPGTRLQIEAPLLDVRTNEHQYKFTYYMRAPDHQPTIKVALEGDPTVVAMERVIQTM